ncbi:MAG TPA: 3'(2'),5'-bisphosphate nucleotidase CysQ [Bacteroidales bacterium]|jgi:3'(2'), 5'-bisphosphate nucleotidase|nr:3'(2'),5'-bisphosphate nucleotidase CysQ [Bacteroidales bacterium]
MIFEFSKAIEAALNAGIEIMHIYESEDLRINTKNDSSPVTQADIAASNIIETILHSTHIPIICEETTHAPYSIRSSWNKVWIIDPLDGTKDFIERNGEFTVNIALIEKNIPLFGVIYIPVYDTLYFGGQNYGSYMLTQCSLRIDSFDYEHIASMSVQLPLTETCNTNIIVASRSFFDSDTQEYIDSFIAQHPGSEIKHLGSSLKFLEVATGKAYIYPRKSHIHEWDVAAGHAIAEGAGCIFTTIDTHERIGYNSESLLCPAFILQRKN